MFEYLQPEKGPGYWFGECVSVQNSRITIKDKGK